MALEDRSDFKNWRIVDGCLEKNENITENLDQRLSQLTDRYALLVTTVVLTILTKLRLNEKSASQKLEK